MSSPASESAPAVSRKVGLLVSVAVVAHLSAITLNALAAVSGPWPTGDGPNVAAPPAFALQVQEKVNPTYLRALKMTHNFHFTANRPDLPGVELEVRLKDASGRVTETLHFPDPSVNAWVRRHQMFLVRALADDRPLPPAQGESVAAPGQQAKTVTFWAIDRRNVLSVRTVPEHLLPRDRQVFRPSEWSLLLAQSYGRHLCRTHGAASVEIIRRTREAIPPAVLNLPEPPAELFETLSANFGEFKP